VSEQQRLCTFWRQYSPRGSSLSIQEAATSAAAAVRGGVS
jgi:hypothetical protein